LTEEQVLFASEGLTLYGVLHRAEADSPRPALVFCPPFAEERKCAHRIMVECARVLCPMGVDILRFDLRGCGDSEGEFGQATLTRWLSDLETAAHWLTEHAQPSALGLLGLRLGASLAAQYTEQHPEVRWLGLWEPVTDGSQDWRLSLRRQQIRQAITQDQGLEDSEAAPSHERGYDLDGYEVSEAMRREFAQLSLLHQPRVFRGPVWIAQISATAAPHRAHLALQQAYQQSGASCDLEVVVAEPFWSLLGLARAPELIAKTVGAACRTLL